MVKSIGNVNFQVKMPGKRRSQGPDQRRPLAPLQKQGRQGLHKDKVSLKRKQLEPATYGGPQRVQVASNYNLLRNLVVKILEEQGVALRIGSGDSSIDLRNLTPAEAQGLISEDGYLGVEQTSERIVKFAISVAGDDPGKLEEIKASIDKGFEMASKAFGGALPEICMKTYDAIMEKLDAWASSKESGHL